MLQARHDCFCRDGVDTLKKTATWRYCRMVLSLSSALKWWLAYQQKFVSSRIMHALLNVVSSCRAESKGWVTVPLRLNIETVKGKSHQQNAENTCGVTMANWSSGAVRTNGLSVTRQP